MKLPPSRRGSASPEHESAPSGVATEPMHASGDFASYANLVHAFLFAVWVAVCSVSPEFIWQGFLRVIHHFDWITAGSALLVGAIVAFFVEPITERLRAMRLHLAHRHKTTTHATAAAFSFAILAVFAHEAITAYASGADTGEQARDSLFYAISEVIQWAWIPFMVTIAWLCARKARWIRLPVLLLALASIVLIGFVFDWYAADIFTTTVPCMAVLLGGFRLMRKYPDDRTLSHCTVMTACIAFIWLASMGLLQAFLSMFAFKRPSIYSWSEYVIDFRFYLGWVIGLAVAPKPTIRHAP
jgi:hypothetical protein